MTAKEFKKIIEEEVNPVAVAQNDNGDVYVIDAEKLTVLAWICGKEAEHFISYSDLDNSKSWMALINFAETPPAERGLPWQAN